MKTQTNLWKLSGFKGISEAEIPLGGLSVLAGINSAGKSSATQSLLMLAQSSGTDIVLNGPLARFGAADDAINENFDHITIGWEAPQYEYRQRGQGRRTNILAEVCLSRPKRTDQKINSPLVVSRIQVSRGDKVVFEASNERVEAKTTASRNPGFVWGDSLLRVRSINEKSAPGRTYVAFAGMYPAYGLYKANAKQFAGRISTYYCRMRKGLKPEQSKWVTQDLLLNLVQLIKPATSVEYREEKETLQSRIFEFDTVKGESTINTTAEDLIEELASAITRDDYIAFSLDSRVLRPFRLGLSLDHSLVIPDAHQDSWRAVLQAFERLRQISEQVRYIGPLREEPQVLSTTGGRNDTTPAGLRGEYTADLLFRNRGTHVHYIDPVGADKTELLQDAVGVWSAQLGVGDRVKVTDQGKLGRGIVVEVNGRERDLTTIGVGVSQLLPVIAVVLSVPPGSILILEQPELHLHPAIQSRLANFLAYARPDISLIVETHSEYLITKLRRLNVEDNDLSGRIHFLFAKPNANGTQMSQLEIGSLGDIAEWPPGFFDTQEQEERKLLVALSKRARGR